MLEFDTSRLPDDEKFKELVVFISERSEGDPSFGATKLNKLLFYADFIAYRRFGSAISWHRYQRLDNGPAPRRMLPIVQELEDDGAIIRTERDFHGLPQKTTRASRQARLGAFTADEIALVTSLIGSWWGKTAKEISYRSHQFIGWQIAENGEDIPYELALVNPEKPTKLDIARALEIGPELQARAQECLSEGNN